jgi:outer membrane protein OmpA-like peptidoglycan-associated protein
LLGQPQHNCKDQGWMTMQTWKPKVTYIAALCFLFVGLANGVSNGEKAKIKGVIATRTGETLVVSTSSGDVTVVLTDDTKVKKSAAVLIPGLRVTVEGVGDAQSRVVAKSINFDSQDLENAEAIQAGATPTKQAVKSNAQNIAANKQANQANAQATAANQVQTASNKQEIDANQQQIDADQQKIQANTKRFSELSEYDIKGDLTVNFASGSSVISANDKTALSKLAQDALNLTGYIISVKGFASTTGGAAMNQKLSMDRAQAVMAYLIQSCNVPVRHIVAPGAMGTADPAAPNETAQGRAENRRAEVKVLVNKGLAGQ